MPRRLAAATLAAVALVVVALAGAVPAVGAAGAGPAGAPAGDLTGGFAQTGDVATDQVLLRAAVAADGDARWRIAYRIELSDENTTEAFESLRADIRANRSAYTDRFGERIASTVAAAENATGREMSVANVTVSASRVSLGSDYGVVAYGFTWKNFAATEGNRLLVGGALAGLYLDADTSLTFAWPDDYTLSSVAPDPDERDENSVTWRGERTFGPDQPSVTLAPASTSPVPLGSASVAVAVAAVVLLGIAGAVYLRRRGDLPLGEPVGDAAGEGSAAAADVGSDGDTSGAAGAQTGAAGEAESGTDAASGAGAGAGAGTDAAAAAGTDAGDDGAEGTDPSDATPPEELLSPRERVVRLVEANGGRMKQADVTDELGWSAARTSQVVGDLRDDGEIESFRLGRENVLRLPEADDEPHPGDPEANEG